MRHAAPLLIACALLASTATAWATGGRLDKDGCHNSKKAGYHCHREQKAKKSSTTAPKPAGAASATKPVAKP